MRAASIAILGMMLLGCDSQPWNSPYPSKESNANIHYSAFAERPKYLDPAKAYSVNEAVFISQIYEPPLQYHYFKRPYALEPLTAAQMPTVQYFDAEGEVLPANTPPHTIAMSVYDISIKPGILYQPHPAFAKLPDGQYRYHNLSEKQVRRYSSLSAFKETGTRELTAEDYVYQIKRLAKPDLNSPISGLMSKHIVGLREYSQVLREVEGEGWLDLRGLPIIRRHRIRSISLSNKNKRRLPPVSLLASHEFFRAHALGGRIFSQPTRHERAKSSVRLVSCGHRALSTDHQQPKPQNGVGTKS